MSNIVGDSCGTKNLNVANNAFIDAR